MKSQLERGTVTKNQWLTLEMRSRHRFEVAIQNAVARKIAKSRHGTEVATQSLLRRQKNVVATNIKMAGNRIDVATRN